jgi:nucleotide-binding universal stress UspA family protein
LIKDFMDMPPQALAGGPELPRFERILCAVDLEQPTPNALSLASFIAERFGAELEALYVGPTATSGDAAVVQRLDQVVERLGSLGTTARLASGAPAQTILERANSRRCDLIVLGSRQRSDLGWQFRDDVVRDVSALADCATLTVHERDTAAAIERILVPVDFGPATSCMVDWACSVALRFGAEIELLHVVSRERSVVGSSDLAELSALEQRVRSLGIEVNCQVLVAGSVANGIEGYNEQGEFDLIVMGLGGEPQSPTRLTRGVIATLRNRLSVPVLSVRAAMLDATRPRARAQSHQSASDRGARAALSA